MFSVQINITQAKMFIFWGEDFISYCDDSEKFTNILSITLACTKYSFHPWNYSQMKILRIHIQILTF